MMLGTNASSLMLVTLSTCGFIEATGSQLLRRVRLDSSWLDLFGC